MNRLFVRRNITAVSVFIFIGIFFIVMSFRPRFIYDKDGSFRQFGLGSRNKTVIPVWLVTIILAFISYLFVLYYLAMPKILY